MRNLIISTVGTSLITNKASKEELKKLYEYSNCNDDDCPQEIKDLVTSFIPKILEELKTSDIRTLRKSSAELNGILGFYNDNLSNGKGDFHILICTDTFQGKKAAEVVKDFLQQHEIACYIYFPRKLSTKDKESFSEGVKNLLKYFDETLPNYRKQNYQIVFNLTGGFKSMQGFLNTIAMFYADKVIYIFESRLSELIEIPRLPIKIDLEFFKENADKLLLLSVDKLRVEDLQDVPETLFDKIDDNLIFSVWGELLWNKVKYDLFDHLPKLPFIKYEDTFIKCFNNIVDKYEKIRLLEKIAYISAKLYVNKGDIAVLKRDGGLQYDNYVNKKVDGFPIGHFRINDAFRVSCIYKNQNLYLRKYGNHDFVNDNP